MNGIKQEAVEPSFASKFVLNFNSDALVQGSTPETIDDVVTFIENLPKRMEDGGEKCLSFVLFPLLELVENVNNFEYTMQPIEKKVLCSLGDIVSKIHESMDKLITIQTLTGQNEFCVPQDIRRVIKLKRGIMDQTVKNITETLVNIRSGQSDTFELDMIEQTFLESSSVLDQFFQEIQHIVDRVNFINYAKNQGAIYIGQISSFEEARRKIILNEEYYVLFYSHKSVDLNKENTSQNMGLFSTLLKRNVPCFLADLDMQPDLSENEKVPQGTRICHYVNKEYKDYDVYNTYKEERTYNLVRSVCEMQQIPNKPKKRAVIDLICPGSLNGCQCNSDKKQWVCVKCNSPMEYGFDEMFYCDCGKEFMNTFEFRCIDVNHGDKFISFDTNVLKLKLDEIEIVREINILVLGESGVGKSTWINAVANYLTFPTLQEAADVKDLLCLVPTKFTLLDEQCKEKVVSIGSSKNEETRAGQACTQHPTAHLITFGTERIRIIDTPGIGDPRGVEQDKINVDNILRFVSGLDEIHGICLLLKPNNARLTTFFKFCIKEILAHLHKSSVENLLFCFTNTRSTFYKPGDTYPALKELLSEINLRLSKSRGSQSQIVLSAETMFCLDNEAFRFLCARRNNVDFNPEDFQNFSLSWDKSATETQRMLNYIKSRKPHNINETMSINEARNTILTLARPMAKISDNITTNIRIAEQQKKFTMSLDDEKLKLQKNRLVEHVKIETVAIDYPKTVCTNDQCIERRGIPGTNESMVIYKTVCHDHCYLRGVNTETVGAPQLSSCSAIVNSKYCSICGCIWQNHMHITYNFQESMVKIPDMLIEKMIKENAESRIVKEQMILNLEEKIEQYRVEQDQILNISTHFGALLKGQAIIPYNDAFESHVRHELRLATSEEFMSTDSAKKKAGLEKLLNEYLEKKRMLDEAMAKNDVDDVDDVTVDDVDNLKDQLMNLKLSGDTFKDCFQTATNSQSQLLNYVEKPVNIKKRNYIASFSTKMWRGSWKGARNWFGRKYFE